MNSSKEKMSKKTVIGITGGLATGKTTVAEEFRAKGAVKLDADAIAHKLIEANGIKERIVGLFGSDILENDGINRKKLAGKVFSDKGKLKSLCEILHPLIIREIKEQVELTREKVIVIDAPLLIEAGLQEYVDAVIVVTAGYKTQIQRAVDRGISANEAEKIIANQMSLSEKVKFADYIIDGEEDINKVKEGVNKIWQGM
ncbi:MAG: dephospho-CoA kinase [Candidatus Omnitrophota bacterium]